MAALMALDRAQSLQSLLAAAQAGDEAAQSAIFGAYRQRVAAHVHRMTGDPDVVDDLVQEVFISAFGGLSAFRGDAQLGTWLYRITANKVRNWWDAQRRRLAREHRAAERTLAAPPLQEDRIEAAEHRQQLYAALGRLPDILREAFVARAIMGMGLSEASELLGVPISTLSYRTRRAEQLLCEALGIAVEEGS
jgi:RNA polymerase sigma-70 factor (ECF subfamily)